MTDLVVSILLVVIALAIVIKTVFYVIEVIVNNKMTKKSFKLINKIFKKYEPMFDVLSKYADKLDEDL